MRSLRAELEDSRRAAAAHALAAAQKLAEAQVWMWCPLSPMMGVKKRSLEIARWNYSNGNSRSPSSVKSGNSAVFEWVQSCG